MAGNIKGITIEIGANTTALSKALEDVNKRSRSLQSELRQVENLLKLNPGNIEVIAQKQELLSKATATAREKLDSLRAAQAQVEQQFSEGKITDEQYRAFTREVAKAEGEIRKFEQGLSDLKAAAEGADRKISDVGIRRKTQAGTWKPPAKIHISFQAPFPASREASEKRRLPASLQ